MSKLAIRAEKLSKLYYLGERLRYYTLRDKLARFLTPSLGRISSPTRNCVWALKDVTFEIKEGEVVGVIGRNGAGKSTLLKILSRITEPTEGRAEIHGRVGSLLEVGTGFHPELTGRENIYLNGAILGMKKAEINLKFEEIIAFAELEKFIDTPVKHYSSGMYVRLAFAVAAHLEPEILLVDEVLAVGDIVFQKKCLGKMGEVAKSGRTVLFVSHNMPSVANLCSRVIWLDNGIIVDEGKPQHSIDKYLGVGIECSGERVWNNIELAPGDEVVKLKAIRILDYEGKATSISNISKPIIIELEFVNFSEGEYLNTSIHLYTKQGICVFSSNNIFEKKWHGKKNPRGLFKSRCTIPCDFLNDGYYSVSAFIGQFAGKNHVRLEGVISFQAVDSGEFTKEYSGSWNYGDWIGCIRPKLDWETTYVRQHDLLIESPNIKKIKA